jgi:nucleotide-binding universal stress UspA family protein
MFRTILVAVDLADLNLAKPAIEEAAALAHQSGGALRLINVQTMLPATFMDYVPEDFDRQIKENAETQLRHVSERVPLDQSRISFTVRIGGIYPEILSEAEEWRADLIVVGSHRPAMSTYLLGSNAKTIARHAKCSVLIVRE